MGTIVAEYTPIPPPPDSYPPSKRARPVGLREGSTNNRDSGAIKPSLRLLM
jgi:hypothetical protein